MEANLESAFFGTPCSVVCFVGFVLVNFVWRVKQIGDAEKKFKIAFLSEQLLMEQIYPKKFHHLSHRRDNNEVFSNHIQLVLSIFIASCLFSD